MKAACRRLGFPFLPFQEHSAYKTCGPSRMCTLQCMLHTENSLLDEPGLHVQVTVVVKLAGKVYLNLSIWNSKMSEMKKLSYGILGE